MAGHQLSYDYQNSIRDMSNVFQTIVQKNPLLSSILTVDNSPFRNTKLEWLDDITSPLSRSVTGNHTAGDGEVLTTDTSGLEQGMVVQFDHATTGKRSTLIALVGTITANTKFAITVYGGSIDENIALGSTISVLSKPLNESTTSSVNNGFEPLLKFNYSQILDRAARVSKTAMATGMYGINLSIGEVLNYQVEKQLAQIAYHIGATSINMPRVQRTSGAAGSMGGWMWLLAQEVGNSVDGSAGNISSATLNKAFENARSNGSMPQTIVAHPVHAKYFKVMNQQSNNATYIMRDDSTAGSYVANFISDFGDTANIVYSYDMDKDKIALIDPTAIKLRPMDGRAFTDADATLPGADYVERRILGEYSLEVRNAKAGHSYIYDLTN